MMDLQKFLEVEIKAINAEGCIANCPEKCTTIVAHINKNINQNTSQTSQIPKRRMLQIGFNAGHSTYYFLDKCNGLVIDSIDIGTHSYVVDASHFIETKFPGRHTLVIQDSRVELPRIDVEKGYYDYIFIDGGHDEDVAKQDFENIQRFSDEKTIIIFDDVYFGKHPTGWTKGPTKVLNQAL